jgi:hypothetical protein
MITPLQRSFSALLVLLMSLTTFTARGAHPAAPALEPAQTSAETMPQGLMRALLEASSQPFAADADGYHARSGGLDFTLHGGGLQASADGLAWGLALSGLGRGEQIAALGGADIVQTASRLEYRRGALTEWYRDTALGVEQGFTIHQASAGAGALVLRLYLSTDLAGMLDPDGHGLSFAAPDGQTLRYDHVRAWDAYGGQLESGLLYAPGQVTLCVNDEDAAYPLTIDPLIYVEQKVIGSGAAEDRFGTSVALWGDTALVGAPSDDVGANNNQGSAYVFTSSGTTWSLQGKLTASDGAAAEQFGSSVAVSGDTALVGVPYDEVGLNQEQGSAYVFTRSGTTWSQQGKLTALDGAAQDRFGLSSVALSGDTALVGVPYDDVGSNGDQGSAYVFTGSGTTWTQQGKLTASDGEVEDWIGYSVALSGDTALVGAGYEDVGANSYQGSVYVFTRSGTTWGQQGQLTALDGAGEDYFGFSVALCGDTAVVGAEYDDVGVNTDQGSVYVFTRSGTTWSQQGQLIASDGATYDEFGVSVALWGDTVLVGAYADAVGANTLQGSAYVFTRSGTTWSQQGKLTASDGAAEDRFGYSVALWGNTALVGAPTDDVGANENQGSAYFYTFSWTTYVPLILKKAS